MAIIGNANYYIFTGGPGSGKSTVLNILENMGYMTVREVARDIIKIRLGQMVMLSHGIIQSDIPI